MKIFLFLKPKFHYKIEEFIRESENSQILSIKSVARIRILRFQNINPNRRFINGVILVIHLLTQKLLTQTHFFFHKVVCILHVLSFIL